MKSKMLKKILAILIICLVSSSYASPLFSGSETNFRDWNKPYPPAKLGILNPQKLSVNHYAEFGAYFGSGYSANSSMFGSTFSYQISNPVTVSFMVGAQRTQFGRTMFQGQDLNVMFGGFGLDYRPSENFHLKIQIERPIEVWGDSYPNRINR